MTANDLSSFKDLYLKTARKYLQTLEADVNGLVKDATNKETVNQIYIAAHSLKSQSIAMGYTHVGSLCGEIEFIFRDIKQGGVSASKQLCMALFPALEKVRESLESIEKNNTEINLIKPIRQLEESVQHMSL